MLDLSEELLYSWVGGAVCALVAVGCEHQITARLSQDRGEGTKEVIKIVTKMKIICVCVRWIEREGEKERKKETFMISSTLFVFACVFVCAYNV